jgi:hypothetical protein
VPVAARIALALLDRRTLQWLLWLIAGGLLLIVVLFGGLAAQQSSDSPAAAGPSATAVADIPGNYLAAYQAAAARYGLDWAILAGIGKVECDHGRDPDPSCNVPGAENFAGAGGPMQFLAASWTSYGVTPSGQHAPAAARWNYTDAIYSAANLLRAAGAPADYYQAIYAYNHAGWYVAEVEAWAAKYRAAAATAIPVGTVVPGTIARIDPSSGYAIPAAGAPRAVQQMILAGDRIVHFPYVYGGGHGSPQALSLQSPQPDGGGYDCSSSTSYLLHAAGLLLTAEASGQLEHWGVPGPGRWVTVYANSGHAFIAVGGIVMDTAYYAPVHPTNPASGPRWQPASMIAAQASGSHYGPFVARHPPGL